MALANIIIVWLLLSGIGSLVMWADLRRRRLVWWAAANVVAAFLIYHAALPAGTDIRVDLFLTVPVLLMVVVRAIRERPPAA